ncbi:MAG TPA: glycosyltransferase family 39 protein [Dehalococcoidia bacterium]|nr:glycosyltransferase family 39 protein [Dehalococcoidia bacterium]
MPSIPSPVSAALRATRILPASGWVLIALTIISLLSRLPLLTISLEEVDSANFVNSLVNGYNIPLLRPHPPGYPVYIFLGWLLDLIVDNPHLSLTLLSAILGSLSVVPLFLILKDQTSFKLATVGSLLFLANPLFWSFSEAALSDVPSVFFLLVLAWLSLRARISTPAFLLACVMCSLAIGLRQANLFSLIFVAFPIAHRWISERKVPWKLGVAGAAVLIATTFVWLLPMVYVGSDGILDYWAALDQQWSRVVSISDITRVESPVLLNAIIRIERFSSGYLLSHLWLGSNSNDLVSLLLLAPWVFGFALFVIGFQLRNSGHVFMALWVGSLVYTIVSIHFLPRYGLAQFPAFLIACLIGYQFLSTQLAIGKLRLEALIFLAMGCVLLISAIKLQPSIPAFEVTPPPGSLPALLLVVGGTASVLAAKYLQFRDRALVTSLPKSFGSEPPIRWLQPQPVMLVCLMLLAIPVAARGFTLASIAHRDENPIQQMVEAAKDTYGVDHVTPCWDSQTHSFFELSDPTLVPAGYWSSDELFDAYRAGNTLLVTDQCPRYDDINANIGLTETGEFSGDSPLWAKIPTLTLFATASPPEGPLVFASASPVAAYVELQQEVPRPLPAALATDNSRPDPPVSLLSRGTGAGTVNSDATENRIPDPPMSLGSRGTGAELEQSDIERFITVEPLTEGPNPKGNQFFGLPTAVVLSILAVLVSISIFQVIRTW